jgi:hypothetical protein
LPEQEAWHLPELVKCDHFRKRFALDRTEVVYGISDWQQREGSICGREPERFLDFVFEEQVVGRQTGPKPDCTSGKNQVLDCGINARARHPRNRIHHRELRFSRTVAEDRRRVPEIEAGNDKHRSVCQMFVQIQACGNEPTVLSFAHVRWFTRSLVPRSYYGARPAIDIAQLSTLVVAPRDDEEPILFVATARCLNRRSENFGQHLIWNGIRLKASQRSTRMDRLEKAQFGHRSTSMVLFGFAGLFLPRKQE